MAKFNQKSVGTKTLNKEGAPAFSASTEYELAALALTSFCEDKFYETKEEGNKRLASLAAAVNKDYLGKLSVFARKEFHMRSVSHVLAAELAYLHKGQRKYLEAVVERPDDMNEMVAYYGNKYGKPIPNAMKKAIANRLCDFDAYQLAKYKCENRAVKLIDLFNLTHPKPSSKEVEKMWGKLLKGELAPAKTWEVMSSTAKSDEDRTKGWEDMIVENRMGYMALLRNLRNLEKYDVSEKAMDAACKTLVKKGAIKKSKQLPFRFYTAYQHAPTTKLKDAVSVALDIAVENVPSFKGRTAVLVDKSGSMMQSLSGRSTVMMDKLAVLFAGALFKANPENVDVVAFSNNSVEIKWSSRTPLIDLVDGFQNACGGTNLSSAINLLTKKNKEYDRIIILSDMQTWTECGGYWGGSSPVKALENYVKTVGKTPKIYSVDLAGYGTHQFPENNIFLIAGWSEKIFDLMKFAEEDKKALVNRIKNYKV